MPSEGITLLGTFYYWYNSTPSWKVSNYLRQKNDHPREEQRIFITTLIYFIDYLLQIPKELTVKLRNEIILTKEEKEMWYLDRKNLPPTFGELEKIVREEGREEGRKEGLVREQRKIAKSMLNAGFTIETIVKLTELSEEEVRKL